MTNKKDQIADLFGEGSEPETGLESNGETPSPGKGSKTVKGKLEDLTRRAQEKKAQREQGESDNDSEDDSEVESTLILSLKPWANDQREAPNEALRCALFTPRNRKTPRESFKNHSVAAYGNARVLYTGEELRQDDLDVWLQVLHMAREHPLGEPIRFSANEMKKALKWNYGAKTTERLKTNLTRLQANAVKFESDRLGKGVSLSLINKFEFSNSDSSDESNYWVIEIDPDIAKLFGGGVYSTRLEWEQRLEINGELAKWLHGFYSSHREPHDISVDLLMSTSGSKVSSKHKAKQLLIAAHEELIRVGCLKEYQMTEAGKFRVKRPKKATPKPE